MRADRFCLYEHPLWFSACCVIVVATATSLAHAQSSAAESESDTAAQAEREAVATPEVTPPEVTPPEVTPPEVTPPRLLSEAAVPSYTDEALAENVEGRVVLRLVVASTGDVSEVRVVQGLGYGLDERAAELARSLRFEPARRGDSAAAAAVLFPVDFVLPASAETDTRAVSSVPTLSVETSAAPAQAPAKEATAAQAPAKDATAAQAPDQQVTVQGLRRDLQLRRSAQPITVVDLTQQSHQSADLGEVLSRQNGVTVQRLGGLGSQARLSLNGLSGDRVPVFIDGIPLKYAGYVFGVSNVPVNLVSRLELYQGVVPIGFGADALGGAIHLVTDGRLRSNTAAFSYQMGSFNTHRLSAAGNVIQKKTGLVGRVSAFLDSTDNDYPVRVKVWQPDGSRKEQTVRRFHDGYHAAGGQLSAGVVDKSWARKLLVGAFYSFFDREVQNNPDMTVPYGEVTFQKQSVGGHVNYVVDLSDALNLTVRAGYSLERTHFVDVSNCRYSWYGVCEQELAVRGEIRQFPVDRLVLDHAWFLRAQSEWQLAADHTLRLSVAPTVALRKGDDAELTGNEYDTLNTPQTLTSLVGGAEWESYFWQRKIVSSTFAKVYEQQAYAEELLGTGELEALRASTLSAGGGEGLRVMLGEMNYIKASYEYATRLPNAGEYFGDAGLTIRNIELAPERSHNANLGLYSDGYAARWGTLSGSLGGFYRGARDLIALMSSGAFLQYQNVGRVRALGLDATVDWNSPQQMFHLGTNLTWQDLRNTSDSGPMARFRGDRVPHRPYLQGALRGGVSLASVLLEHDGVELSWNSRYVHKFYRGWESAGAASSKLVVPSQISHSVSASYVTHAPLWLLTNTFEVQNLTNAELYDLYGVQRPGRSYFFKITLETR